MSRRFRMVRIALLLAAFAISSLVHASSCKAIFSAETRLSPPDSTFSDDYSKIIEGFASDLRTMDVEVITISTYSRSRSPSALGEARQERIGAIKQHLISMGFAHDKILTTVGDLGDNSFFQEGVIYLEAFGLNRKCLNNPQLRP